MTTSIEAQLFIAIGTFLFWFTIFLTGIWLIGGIGKHWERYKKYLYIFKIGRLEQLATQYDINLDKLEAKLANKKSLNRTWTQKIEDELSNDLDSEELEINTKNPQNKK